MTTMMNTTETTTDEAQDATLMVDTTQVAGEAQEPAEDDNKAGREAAKYRRQLREVETERDGLREALDAVHKARVADFLKVAHTLTPAALWAAGITLDDVRGEDGQVALDLVQQAAAAAAKKLGVQGRIPSAPPAAGVQGRMGVPIGAGQPGPTWQGVLHG